MGRRARTSSISRRKAGKGWRPAIVPRPRKLRSRRTDTNAELDARIERIAGNLYDLYADLRYFIASSAAHRERLRARLSWPDVGHITSLMRSLAEEDRFNEWVRFNRYVKVA
jgi:hypothetical protein